jgi:hypothetical protein
MRFLKAWFYYPKLIKHLEKKYPSYCEGFKRDFSRFEYAKMARLKSRFIKRYKSNLIVDDLVPAFKTTYHLNPIEKERN